MRALIILILALVSSPAISQSELEKLHEMRKTECLNREVKRIMHQQSSYSVESISKISRDAANNCRGFDIYQYSLEQEAIDIVKGRLPNDQKYLADKQECLSHEVDLLMKQKESYSLASVAALARSAAHFCRGSDPYDPKLEATANELAYKRLPDSQRQFLDKTLEDMRIPLRKLGQ